MSIQAIVQEILETGKYAEQDIAQYAGVSRETIRRIKIGKTKKPSLRTSTNIMSLYFSLQQEADKRKSRLRQH